AGGFAGEIDGVRERRDDGEGQQGRRARADPGHDVAPTKCRRMPIAEHAANVVIMPTLKRKMATIAAADSASAQGSTLAGTGSSKLRPYFCTGVSSRKMLCKANQIARLSTTPTTAAVIAESAPLSALLPRSTSMKGAPRKIQRKHGVNVTQVASSPPSVPA